MAAMLKMIVLYGYQNRVDFSIVSKVNLATQQGFQQMMDKLPKIPLLHLLEYI